MRLASSVAQVGIGLRSAHYDRFLNPDGPLANAPEWLEIHAENYFERGGIRHTALCSIAARFPVSVHGVAMSLGSADGVDNDHLDRLAALVDDVDACFVSEHLAWSRTGGVYYNDLLPLPLTDESLDVVSANVDRVQERLGRAILIENPSAYTTLRQSTIGEADFLARLVARTGCGLLLDVNNLFVSAVNVCTDIDAWLGRIPAEAIGEIHLAGHEVARRDAHVLLIDTHGCAVSNDVWSLYAAVIARFGTKPTLIEWDSNLPALDTLLNEAAHARDILLRTRRT
jgi:uncharacterized protein (UPF0276 family)